MRLLVVCGVLTVLMLAGCAETPAEVNEAIVDSDPADGNHTVADGALAGLAGTLVASLDNLTVFAGMPFNVTLDYAGDNATNASALVWQVSFSDELGNATSYNGTGLPALFEANLTFLGNVTMVGNASSSDGGVSFEPVLLSVMPSEPAYVDPCIGAAVQETVTLTGSNLAPGDGTDHPFELMPCQNKLIATISMGGGTVDNDWFLYNPSGSEMGSGTSFTVRGENGITVDGAAKLVPGEWKFMVENFAGAAASYTITVTFE